MTNPLCHATNRAGNPCGRYAISGGTTCPTHGGSAPQVRLAAQRRLATQEATAIVAAYPHEPIDDPGTALLTVAAEYVALKDELGRRAAELESLAVKDRHGAEQVAAVLTGYMHALDSVSDVLVKINRLGLENRRVMIAESDYRALVAGLKSGLDEACRSLDPPLSHESVRFVQQTIFEHINRIVQGDD